MSRKIALAVSAAVFCCAFAVNASAQTGDKRFEAGGQFSILDGTNGRGSVTTVVVCIQAPCQLTTTTTSAGGRTWEPGFGARVGYRASRYFTLESEVNFFPRERSVTAAAFDGGRKTEAVFGAKVGRRFERVGVFAKARPGFVRFSQGDFRPAGACILSVPQPIACFAPTPRTDFAFDAGGVLEFYPSARSIVRFDAGDTVLREGAHTVPVPVPSRGTFAAGVAGATRHNFQGGMGVGFRF